MATQSRNSFKPASRASLAANHAFRQGTLDSLCGVYSTVNSISLLLEHTIPGEMLFAHLIQNMGERLGGVILYGIYGHEFERFLLQPVATLLRRHGFRLNYTAISADSLDAFWQAAMLHCAEHGPGSILLRTEGEHDHLTCVRKITERSIMLADSGDIRRLDRRHCTVGDATKGRPHRVVPHETYLLSVEAI